MQPCTHVQVCTHACIHACIHARTHARTHTNVHVHTNARARAPTCAHAHAEQPERLRDVYVAERRPSQAQGQLRGTLYPPRRRHVHGTCWYSQNDRLGESFPAVYKSYPVRAYTNVYTHAYTHVCATVYTLVYVAERLPSQT